MTLENLHILVTRPEAQAEGLAAAIQKQGGQPIIFPTIEIKKITDATSVVSFESQLADFDIAIFVSVNAVSHGLHYFPQWPKHLKVAAIGPTTAKQLVKNDIQVTYLPELEFTSEGLLSLPIFNDVSDKKIIIFRGEGGRKTLSQTLLSRGALIAEAVVYQRVMPKQKLDWQQDIDIVTTTSGESLMNLYEGLDEAGRAWLQAKPIVVVSERVAKIAAELGIKKSPIIAANATDDAILAAIQQWAS